MDARHYHRGGSTRLEQDASGSPWVCSDPECFERETRTERWETAAVVGLLGTLAGAALGTALRRPMAGAVLGAVAGGSAGYLLGPKAWMGARFRGLPMLGVYRGTRRSPGTAVAIPDS